MNNFENGYDWMMASFQWFSGVFWWLAIYMIPALLIMSLMASLIGKLVRWSFEKEFK